MMPIEILWKLHISRLKGAGYPVLLEDVSPENPFGTIKINIPALDNRPLWELQIFCQMQKYSLNKDEPFFLFFVKLPITCPTENLGETARLLLFINKTLAFPGF